MEILSTLLFLIVALVNLAPVIGVASASRLQGLYGVTLDDPNLVILMRHRAVLLGIVGALLAVCAFQPSLRPFGVAAGLISMLSFVVLVYFAGDFNSELRRVAVVDLVASALLIGGFIAGRG